jgi:DNA-binding transcriptional MerR regulator
MANEAMQKQYRDLKSKHPDAMLLFRCGDFYETYEDDAKECAKVLGITLTKRQSDGVAMAGFPHHALDTYLPKLVRAANSGQMKFKRIAICDQLDPPPGPKRKRGESETSNSSDNNQNSEDKVMTNENVKVADLIGKSIGNGGNAKYTINAIEGDKVKVTFQMGDSEGKPMTMGVAQVEKLLQGGWKVSDGTQEPTEKKADGGSQKAEEPKAKTVKMTSEREQSGTRSGSAERESSRPQGKMETEPKPKQEKPKAEQQEKVSSSKFQVSSNGAQPTPETSNVKPETKVGKLTYSTYVNGKGKTCAKISGFAETDAAYQKEAAASLHGSATYENTKQGRVNFLLFGPRYAEVAKTVCQMLNEGKTVADCQAVVDAATEERMAKREERKQKREAYRQEHEGKAQTAKPQGKTYTEAEVADLMRRVIEGDKEAIAIVNAMAA